MKRTSRTLLELEMRAATISSFTYTVTKLIDDASVQKEVRDLLVECSTELANLAGYDCENESLTSALHRALGFDELIATMLAVSPSLANMKARQAAAQSQEANDWQALCAAAARTAPASL